jgi:galactoside O-acetyltransferase
MNTLFNVVSGHVYVGDDTLFSHNCQVLTGVHRFHQGKRASLHESVPFPETPTEGNDIVIGRGCFIGAGAIVLCGVSVGDNVIVGAGSVVSSDLPAGVFAAGVPARVVRSHGESGENATVLTEDSI